MNISLAPEKIFTLFGSPITNSILTGWVVTLFLFISAYLLRRILIRIPSRTQAFFELIYSFLYSTAVSIIGREDVVQELFPYLITLFFFIVFSSWFGLLPGIDSLGFKEMIGGKEVLVSLFRAPTTDLNAVAALAVISVFYVQYLGLKYAGVKGYLHKFFNFSNPLGFIVGILELVSESSRLISYSFRLFGNIFAGEVLISVMIYLTSTLLPAIIILPLPFFVLETFVALVQAYVFCFLTIIFTSLAIVSHDTTGRTHGGEELLASENAAKGGEYLYNHPLATNQ